jgi:NADH dehydrogenase FAD-containing subunit
MGREVTLIDAGSAFGEDVNIVDRIVIPPALARLGVAVAFGCVLRSVEGNTAMLLASGADTQLEVDTVVIAAGADAPGAEAIEAWRGSAPCFFNAGESAGMQGVIGATHSGHRVACRIGS